MEPFFMENLALEKSTLYKLISQKIEPNFGEIYFDKKNIKELNQKNFKKNLIYQISDSWIQKININKIFSLLEKEEIKHLEILFKSLKIKINQKLDISKLSKGQKQFLNFINLLGYSEKVLLLDEVLSHINLENKLIIVEHLLPILTKKNFVVWSEHDLKLKKFFNHSINLEENA